MALAARLSLGMLCITCTVLLMSSSTFGQETLYYDEALLRKYVFAAQQLRHQIKRLADSILSTVSEENADITGAIDELSTRVVDARTIADAYMTRVINVTSYMKLPYAPIINVWGSAVYTSVNDPIFTDVQLNYGMKFDPATSEIVVPVSGVYLVEYKLQARYSVSIDLYVRDPEGNQIKSSNKKFLYGCTPQMHVFELEAGSTIQMSNLKPFYSYVSHAYLLPGKLNQLNVRYLGPKE